MPRRPDSWTNSRSARLLSWLEDHPLESKIIYAASIHWRRQKERNSLTKRECYERAAHAVFSVDEDASVRHQLEVKDDFTKLCDRIKTKFLSWKEKYEKINQEILADHPAQRIGEIQLGTGIYKNLSEYYSDFPFWGRLNAQWHKFTSENGTLPVQKKGRVSQESRRKRNVIVLDSDSDSEATRTITCKEEREDTGSLRCTGGNAKGVKRELDGNPGSSPAMKRPKTSHQGTSASHLEEQRLKLELQRLENDALRMKMKMEKQRAIQEERKNLEEAIMGLIKTLPTENAD